MLTNSRFQVPRRSLHSRSLHLTSNTSGCDIKLQQFSQWYAFLLSQAFHCPSDLTLLVIVTDQDYPEQKPVHCTIDWKAGVSPPDSTHHECENKTMRIWFPDRTFNGVKDFQLQFAHTVIDTRYVSVHQSLWPRVVPASRRLSF